MTDACCPPELVAELNSLIAKYGREIIRDCAKALTKPPRGRRPVGHWKLLAPELAADAASWLSGCEPAKNTAIAKRVAKRHPGHSELSTMRQLQKKLARERELRMREFALMLTGTDPDTRAQAGLDTTAYPFTDHFRTLEELVAIDPNWKEWLTQDRLTLERYREIHGDPDLSMTWSEIREKARSVVGGLLGHAGRVENPPN